jgi:hypothetical protein
MTTEKKWLLDNVWKDKTKGAFGSAVSWEKTVVRCLLWKSCCEMPAMKKLKVVWFKLLWVVDCEKIIYYLYANWQYTIFFYDDQIFFPLNLYLYIYMKIFGVNFLYSFYFYFSIYENLNFLIYTKNWKDIYVTNSRCVFGKAAKARYKLLSNLYYRKAQL